MQQKVAACFGAFVSDLDARRGDREARHDKDGNRSTSSSLGTSPICPGQDVKFATPPATATLVQPRARCATSLSASASRTRSSRGDYSQVNYSSARMARIEWANVTEWREHMLIPQLCDGVWAGRWTRSPRSRAGPKSRSRPGRAPPMAILEPDKEGARVPAPRADRRDDVGADGPPARVRPDRAARRDRGVQQALDERGIVLDIDPRKMTAAGQQQAAPCAGRRRAGCEGRRGPRRSCSASDDAIPRAADATRTDRSPLDAAACRDPDSGMAQQRSVTRILPQLVAARELRAVDDRREKAHRRSDLDDRRPRAARLLGAVLRGAVARSEARAHGAPAERQRAAAEHAPQLRPQRRLGVVESAKLEGKRARRPFASTPARGRGRLPHGPRGHAAQRVRRLPTYKMQKVEDGEDTTPSIAPSTGSRHEISLVPIGADAGAVTRSGGGMTPCVFIEERDMPDPENPTTTTTTSRRPRGAGGTDRDSEPRGCRRARARARDPAARQRARSPAGRDR
jgi:hypothetical protein